MHWTKLPAMFWFWGRWLCPEWRRYRAQPFRPSRWSCSSRGYLCWEAKKQSTWDDGVIFNFRYLPYPVTGSTIYILHLDIRAFTHNRDAIITYKIKTQSRSTPYEYDQHMLEKDLFQSCSLGVLHLSTRWCGSRRCWGCHRGLKLSHQTHGPSRTARW